MTYFSFLLGFLATLLVVVKTQPTPPEKAAPSARDIYARDNLVAWCIVPFDAKKRTPAQRVAMLQKLGFKKYAYDWRSEHLPTFEEEIRLLKEAKIELTAVWFPPQLNKDAELILATIKKYDLKPQLWVTLSDPTGTTPMEKVAVAAKIIEPIATEAAKIGCSVGLYNHGGWFGEPENQIAIIELLKLKNIGIVYNLHHGHEQFDRFPEILKKIHPYLYAININGCVKDGHKIGKKILPVGSGELDLKFLSAIRDIGYMGPIGILGHTQDDVAERLADNLDGLAWLLPQLNGKPAGEKPKYRTLPQN